MWASIELWSSTDKVFLIAAVIGSALFVLWLAMQFLGGDVFDTDASDFGAETSHGDISGQADISFTALSFQGISSFLTMFGLTGLAVSRESEATTPIAIGAGIIAGLATMWIISKLFKFFAGLQSSGTIDMRSAIGEEGTVYLSIPENGMGKVRVTLHGHLKVLDAVSDSKQAMATGDRIQVVRLMDGHTLVVAPA